MSDAVFTGDLRSAADGHSSARTAALLDAAADEIDSLREELAESRRRHVAAGEAIGTLRDELEEAKSESQRAHVAGMREALRIAMHDGGILGSVTVNVTKRIAELEATGGGESPAITNGGESK